MMKHLLITTAALAAFAAPSLADTGATKTLGGCEIVDKGGYWNKVDATCVFATEAASTGTGSGYVDGDGDPKTHDPSFRADTKA